MNEAGASDPFGPTERALVEAYGAIHVPLSKVNDLFGYRTVDSAVKASKAGKLPVPIYRLGGSRSPWLIDVRDLARFIDVQRLAAKPERMTVDQLGDLYGVDVIRLFRAAFVVAHPELVRSDQFAGAPSLDEALLPFCIMLGLIPSQEGADG